MNFFKIKIIPVDDKNKGDKVEIKLNEEMFNNFIMDRKLILNNTIYSDKVKYVHTQKNYNKAWDELMKLMKKAGKLDVKNCEVILMEGTKELKEQLVITQQRLAEVEKDRNLMLDEIAELREMVKQNK